MPKIANTRIALNIEIIGAITSFLSYYSFSKFSIDTCIVIFFIIVEKNDIIQILTSSASYITFINYIDFAEYITFIE